MLNNILSRCGVIHACLKANISKAEPGCSGHRPDNFEWKSTGRCSYGWCNWGNWAGRAGFAGI